MQVRAKSITTLLLQELSNEQDDYSETSDQWEVDRLFGINRVLLSPMAGWKKYARIILPHIGLIILSVLYTIGGALAFYYLERPYEIAMRRESLKDISAQRQLMLDELWVMLNDESVSDGIDSILINETFLKQKLGIR